MAWIEFLPFTYVIKTQLPYLSDRVILRVQLGHMSKISLLQVKISHSHAHTYMYKYKCRHHI